MITIRRDLRSGTTLWQANTPGNPIKSIKRPAPFYDVIVIGAGISGALATHALADGKRSLLVIDRRMPATGSTSASTALIQWEVDVPLGELGRKVGHQRAARAYRETFKAVQKLAALIKNQRIKCDMMRRDTLLIAGNEMGPVALRNEADRRRRLGLPSRFLTAERLKRRYGFDRDGAIVSSGSLELDPRKLTLHLLQRAAGRGASFSLASDVVKIDATDSGAFVTLANGDVIASRKLVTATGYETLPDIPASKYDLISTWAMATVPQPEGALWPGRALVWEASDPYLYFRTTQDNRIIVGGEDATFYNPERRDKLIAAKSKRILQKLGQMLPKAKLEADYCWAGTFAESPTGLPVLAPLPDARSVFAVLGAGGNGITYSVIAAEMIAKWVNGRKSPLEATFGLQRNL